MWGSTRLLLNKHPCLVCDSRRLLLGSLQQVLHGMWLLIDSSVEGGTRCVDSIPGKGL
jgi:hypothetical protein